jgi:hypothetical protein
MVSWCPRCGEELSAADVGRLVVCGWCDEPVIALADDDAWDVPPTVA